MKVKYLFDDGNLVYEGIYNVFAIQEWTTKEKKIYISDHDSSGNYYISSYEYDAFEVVDRKISKFWECGVDGFGQATLGIFELFEEKRFWERYYDDDEGIKDILDLYYKVGKEDLFNA